jgi:hypothetical protein
LDEGFFPEARAYAVTKEISRNAELRDGLYEEAPGAAAAE